MLVFVDPYPDKGHSVHFVPDEDAIRDAREAAKHAGHTGLTDKQCLDNFQVTHWADTIEETIEKMAKAMWENFHKGPQASNEYVVWNQVVREPWREQAKAALKSLGVPL